MRQGHFMRIMSDLFAEYLGQFMWVYIDDILIYSDTEEDHLKTHSDGNATN